MIQALRWMLVGALGAGGAEKLLVGSSEWTFVVFGLLEIGIAAILAASARVGAWVLIVASLLAIGASFIDFKTPCGCLGPGTDIPITYRRLIASLAGLVAVGLLSKRAPATSPRM